MRHFNKIIIYQQIKNGNGCGAYERVWHPVQTKGTVGLMSVKVECRINKIPFPPTYAGGSKRRSTSGENVISGPVNHRHHNRSDK